MTEKLDTANFSVTKQKWTKFLFDLCKKSNKYSFPNVFKTSVSQADKKFNEPFTEI